MAAVIAVHDISSIGKGAIGGNFEIIIDCTQRAAAGPLKIDRGERRVKQLIICWIGKGWLAGCRQHSSRHAECDTQDSQEHGDEF